MGYDEYLFAIYNFLAQYYYRTAWNIKVDKKTSYQMLPSFEIFKGQWLTLKNKFFKMKNQIRKQKVNWYSQYVSNW